MAKVKNPLHSFRARGRLAGILDYQDHPAGHARRARVYIQKPKPPPAGVAQEAKQENVRNAVALWHDLTNEEKASWEAYAFDYRRYGAELVWRPELHPYHKFMQCNLRRAAAGQEMLRRAPGTT